MQEKQKVIVQEVKTNKYIYTSVIRTNKAYKSKYRYTTGLDITYAKQFSLQYAERLFSNPQMFKLLKVEE